MSAGKKSGKPKLNRNQLRGHNIEFIEKVQEIDELDNWLQPIVRFVTRIKVRIPKTARKALSHALSEEIERFDIRGQDREDARRNNWCLQPEEGLHYLQKKSYTSAATEGDLLELDSCEKALLDVQLCRERNENEIKWTQILREHIFLDFSNFNRDPSEQKLHGWEIQQDIVWNEFPEWARQNPEIARVTMPKPDLTYGFPIIHPKDDVYKSFNGHQKVDCFSLPVLGELRNRQKDSIVSAPTTALGHWAARNGSRVLEAHHLMCYPWAVVEVKRGTAELVAEDEKTDNKAEARAHQRRNQDCYCQAANASAAALTLREHLAAKAKDRSKMRGARIIFSFTCVGSAIKL